MSVRQRAVDLLYAMCDRSNAEEIVQEMLNYLETADYSIREEMVRICRHRQASAGILESSLVACACLTLYVYLSVFLCVYLYLFFIYFCMVFSHAQSVSSKVRKISWVLVSGILGS